jgi:hypothetical protein
MTPASAGWIVVGLFCAAALALTALGILRVMRAQRELKSKLSRLQETQGRVFDAPRLAALMTRISHDADSAKELLERGRRAASTIGVALRYCALVVRLVRRLT